MPLVTASMEPLRVHFLLPDEESRAYLLLQQYLLLTELQADGDGGCDAVLAANMGQDDDYVLRQRMPTVRDVLLLGLDVYPQCVLEQCRFPALGDAELCIVCTLDCPPYQALVDDELRVLLEGATLPRCANLGCDNESWMPGGGLCRLCSIGCYPRHYDHPPTVFMKERMPRTFKYGMYSVSLSLRFIGNFPGGLGLAGTRMSPFRILLELRMMEVVSGDNWSYKT